jgi:nucleoside-diphosphate-sugar epimerase
MNLAAILSASGEKNPELCYNINVEGFKNVCDLAVEHKLAMFEFIQ